MEDICIVCAEPLLYTAYGACGHKDTCSKCVTRLRSVLKDVRCVYCQQNLPAVFVTRFAGDYTESIGGDDFERLSARAKSGELKYLDSAQAYFDDVAHYKEISALSSYTHPAIWAGGDEGSGGAADQTDASGHRTFHSLNALKRHLQQLHKLQFCEICLEGRKVFISEQQLYTRAQLDRHMKSGDVEGPMAESGFKGHPEFCHRRFYGENELYQHMHTAHEQCFLCRRARPDRYVYYRDYPDLENHFQQEHHLCPHPDCIEKKFVVFASEAELRQHTAREHGETLSKAEKRQALTLPVSFSYRRGPEGADGASSSAAAAANPLAAAVSGGRGAVVIGGAASVPGRFGQRGRAGSRGALAERSATARAVEASLDSAAVEQAVRESAGQQQQQQQQPPPPPQQQQEPALRDSDFPAALGSAAAPAAIGGWAGAAGAGPAGTLCLEDFPALPGTSKSAKRRAAAKKKSMAAALGGGGSVRVVHAAGPLSDREAFPALGAAAAGDSGGAGQGGAGGGASRPSSAGSSIVDAEGYRQLQRDDWDSVLPRGCRAATRQPQASDEEAGAAVGHGLPRPPSAQEIRGPQPEPLSPTAAAAAGVGFAGGSARRGAAKQLPPRAAAGASAALAAGAGDAAAPPAPAPGGISEALREANRALVAKIKARLSPADFGMFRHRSGAWLRGELSSAEYHGAITGLGLVSLVPDLAATCPDEGKRSELLAAHAAAFSPDGSGKARGQWVPPEAAAVAAAQAAANSSWQCSTCTLINAPGVRVCEACGTAKPRPGDAENQWRARQASAQQGLATEPAAGPAARAGAAGKVRTAASAAAAAAPAAASRVTAAAAPAAPVISDADLPPLPGTSGQPPRVPLAKQKLDGGWRIPPATATAPAAADGGGGGSGGSAGAVPTDAFPALPSAAPRPGPTAAPSSSQQQQQQQQQSSSKGNGSKKGRAKTTQSLQEFYSKTAAAARGNAWAKAPGALAQEERVLAEAWGKKK